MGDRHVGGLIRLNADGTEDETFNKGGKGFDSYAAAVAKTPDGKYIVVGHFSKYNDKEVGKMVRLNADGTLDETFKDNNKFEIVNHKNVTEVELQQIIVLPNGQFYVAGCFNRINGNWHRSLHVSMQMVRETKHPSYRQRDTLKELAKRRCNMDGA